MALFTVTSNGDQSEPYKHKAKVAKGYLQITVSANGAGETLGGGTISINKLFPDGVYREIPGASWTSEVSKIIDMEDSSYVKYSVAGSVNPNFIIEFL